MTDSIALDLSAGSLLCAATTIEWRVVGKLPPCAFSEKFKAALQSRGFELMA